METKVHGIPLIIQDVDNEDTKYGSKSYKEMREEWIKHLQESSAVKGAIPKIKRLEIGSLNHFYWKDAKLKFHCKRDDIPTSLERCQDGCSGWHREDMMCVGDFMGEDIDKVERTRSLALDTMHILRIVLK